MVHRSSIDRRPGVYTLLSADISSILAANAGSTLRLRFAEVDNVERFILAIDDVSISTDAATAPVPEPGSMLLLASGLGIVARRLRRQRNGAGA